MTTIPKPTLEVTIMGYEKGKSRAGTAAYPEPVPGARAFARKSGAIKGQRQGGNSRSIKGKASSRKK